MKVGLFFRPTRTREYTRTMLDFVNDMFVPCTELEAVTCTDAAAEEVGQRLIDELKAEASKYLEPEYSIKRELGVWERYLKTLWNDAIRDYELPLKGYLPGTGQAPPSTVYVALKVVEKRIWGGEVYKTYEPLRVAASSIEATGAFRAREWIVVEKPLLGVEALAFTA